MNRPLKRVLGLAGSVAVGLVGAVAFASGAQAHHASVTGTAPCLEADGTWEVTWSVTDWDWKNSHPDVGAGWITGVNSTSDAEIVGGFTLDTTAADQVVLPYPGETPLTATQVIGADVDSVTLRVSGEWGNGQKDDGERYKATVLRPTEPCEQPEVPVAEPSASAVSDCFGIDVTVANNSEVLAEFVLTPSEGEAVTVEPAVGEEFTHYFSVMDPEAGLSVTVTADGQEVGVFEWETGGNCDWGIYYSTCEGLTFELAIPADGVGADYTFVIDGEEVGQVALGPGESETVEFPAEGDELTVSYVIDDGKSFVPGEAVWEKPEGCEEAPAESETPSAAPQLPTTGSSMTIMISAASALVLAAAVLFFIARRRRAAADW